jgi:hypothetical protein
VNTPTKICAQTNTLSPFGVIRSANNPPTANAGPSQTVEATSSSGALVTLTGSGSDPDNDPLIFSWVSATCGSAVGQSVTLVCPLGANSVTLTVSDGRGGTATSSVSVLVRDTTPPLLTLPSNLVAEAQGPAGAILTYAVSAMDLVSGAVVPMCSPTSGNTFPIGTTTVTCSAADALGNTSRGSFTVTVRDTTPPVITITPSQITVLVNSVPATRAALGLPVPVVKDIVDAHPRVTDNAPSSFSTGTYTIVFTATDASGNSAKTTVIVNVELRLTVLNAAVAVTQSKHPNSDLLGAELTVQLGSGNNGINASVDAFQFQLTAGSAAVSINLPLSKFTLLKDGSLVFAGSVNGLPTDLAVKPLGGSKYAIVVGISQASLAAFKNPASIGIALGSDTGSATTNALIIKD